MASGLTLSLNVDGDQEVARVLTGISNNTKDIRPAWKLLEPEFRQTVERQFDSEGAHGGTQWKALSPAYARAKHATYGAQPILVATGALKQSLVSRGPVGETIIERTQLGIGTRISYGRYHQLREGRSKLPRRAFIQPTEQDKRNWIRIFQRWLVRGNRV